MTDERKEMLELDAEFNTRWPNVRYSQTDRDLFVRTLRFLRSTASAPAGDLIAAYDEYITLLTESEHALLGLAYSHGYRHSEQKVKRGAELRETIAALKTATPPIPDRAGIERETIERVAKWHDERAAQSKSMRESIDRYGDVDEASSWRSYKDKEDSHHFFAESIRALQVEGK